MRAHSDSGPIGAQLEKSLGLGDDDFVAKVLQSTMAAIRAEGFTKIKAIGHGGYGVVFRATDVKTGNRRAVKVLIQSENPDHRAIFDRECRMLDASEMPPGIAPKFYGARTPKNAQPFFIQEWINGQKLSDWLDARPTMPMETRLGLCAAIFDTYRRLHEANLVHRDVSLGNIMVAGDRVRLIDFGGGGRAMAGYRSFNTLSRVPTTEAFVSDAVLSGERKPTMADEVHAVAKICFTVLTSQIAFRQSEAERKQALKAAGVPREHARIVLEKMQQPPTEFAMQSVPKEF